MTLAHIAGVPVEETLQPVLIALLLSGTWLSTRLRRPHAQVRRRSESTNERHRYASRAR